MNQFIQYEKYHMSRDVSITAAQIRAARALVDWSGPQLANASGVSVPTIRRMESAVGPERSSIVNVEAVRRALEEAGVIFQAPDDSAGPGVRLKK
jgi:transcriptional regulator with XRE-family HTH domain